MAFLEIGQEDKFWPRPDGAIFREYVAVLASLLDLQGICLVDPAGMLP